LDRSEKIKLLRILKESKVSVSVLFPPKTYVFTELQGEVKQYKMEGNLFSLSEYEKFCKKVETDNEVQKKLNVSNRFSLVITIKYVKTKTIL